MISKFWIGTSMVAGILLMIVGYEVGYVYGYLTKAREEDMLPKQNLTVVSPAMCLPAEVMVHGETVKTKECWVKVP